MSEPNNFEVIDDETISDLEDAVEDVFRRLTYAHASASPEEQEVMSEFESVFEAAILHAEVHDEPEPQVSSFILGFKGLPETYKEIALEYDSASSQLNATKEKYKPEKVAIAVEKLKMLDARLDGDAVVAAAFEVDDLTEITEIEAKRRSFNVLYEIGRELNSIEHLRQKLGSLGDLTFDRVEAIGHALERYEQKWHARGILQEVDKVVDEKELAERFPEHMVGVRDRIDRVAKLRGRYRGIYNYDEWVKEQAVGDFITEIEKVNDALEEDHSAPADILCRGALGAALAKRLEQKVKELPADDYAPVDSKHYVELAERARSLDVGEVVANLEVAGSFEDLPFEYSERDVRFFLATSMPASAVSAIRRITFRPIDPEKDRVKENENTLGFHYWSRDGESEIVISPAKISENYQKVRELLLKEGGADAEELAIELARTEMEYGLSHECAHVLHRTLPIAALERWTQLTAADQTKITQYVAMRYTTKDEGRYMEDFADTAALFACQPHELSVTSPVRFEAMKQIYQEFMQPEYFKFLQERQQFTSHLNKKWSTAEEAKEAYLQRRGLTVDESAL